MANASYPSVLGNSIQTGEVDALAITTAKINAKAVTGAKLADGTANKGMGFDAAGVYAEIPQGSMILLDSHVAAEAEATYTYTPAAALDIDDYAAVIVYITMSPTADLALQAIINAIGGTANYSYGWNSNGSALTNLSATGAAQLQLSAATTTLNSDTVTGWLILQLNEATPTVQGAKSKIASSSREDTMHHFVVGAGTTITSIQIKTSTSTWKTASTIHIYGVRKI